MARLCWGRVIAAAEEFYTRQVIAADANSIRIVSFPRRRESMLSVLLTRSMDSRLSGGPAIRNDTLKVFATLEAFTTVEVLNVAMRVMRGLRPRKHPAHCCEISTPFGMTNL
jgi:hypothetical protein